MMWSDSFFGFTQAKADRESHFYFCRRPSFRLSDRDKHGQIIKLWEKARARWRRWRSRFYNLIIRHKRKSSNSLSLESWNSPQSRTTCLGRHLMHQLDIESSRYEYRTPIFTCREHIPDQLRAYNYKFDDRVLIQLANFAPIVKQLKAATDSAVNIINPPESSIRASWHQFLQDERDEQMGTFRALLTSERRMLVEVGDENQQLEILTLLVHGLENHGDVLSPLELDALSKAYEMVVRLSNTIVLQIPDWFAVSVQEWDQAETTALDGGEEECLRTASLWSELNHPNIRKLFGACHVGETSFVIHEASSLLADESFSWKFLQDIAHGLEYLHDRAIVHKTLSIDNLYTTAGGGVLSGMNLKRLQSTGNQELDDNSIEPLSPATAMMSLGSIIMNLIEGYQQYCWNYFYDVFRWYSHGKPVSLRAPSRILVIVGRTGSSRAGSRAASIWKCHPIREALAQNPPTRPVFVEEDVWDLLVKLCLANSTERLTTNQTVYRIGLLVQQKVSSERPDEDIEDLGAYTYDGLSIESMLEEAAMLSSGLDDPIKKNACGRLHQVASICASRTIAGKNFNIHHDIDRLIIASSELNNEAVIHSWQPGWESARQQQFDAVKAYVENPMVCLNDMNSEEDRREAITLLHLGVIDEDSGVPDWFIPPHQLEIGRHLADGSFGVVYEGTWRGTSVVVKQVLTDQKSASARAQFRQEVDLWFSLNHDHLIKLYGAILCTWKGAVGGLEVYFEAALDLLHLHDRGIIHGDLKGNNILVCDGKAKLADFGLSIVANRPGTEVIGANGALGAFRWKAPECLLGGKPTFASDIYSFGMCIVEVITGEPPCRSLGDDVVRYNVVQQRLFPPRPDHIDEYEWKLASRMCHFDPDERITANAVASYAFDQYQALEYWYHQENGWPG
ncbi:hypothetical protein ON010_g14670 [Phytophthora cinnamomi]|nr:hypothetical protein ON010_g14670 [Phytophthora cinnamomi]